VKYGFIFDFDGTVADSGEGIVSAVLEVYKGNGMPAPSKEFLHRQIGLPAQALFPGVEGPELDGFIELFREFLTTDLATSRISFPGVGITLKTLHQMGHQIAIATSKPHRLIKQIVADWEYSNFLAWVQGVDGFPPKPDPEVILRCQKKLDARKYVMVGDRPEDMIAGKRASCFCIGITQGHSSSSELDSSGADIVYDSIVSLYEDLDNLVGLLEKSDAR
jgi:phosphoglycolate phosphatase-like HAD superfamily hydrolase